MFEGFVIKRGDFFNVEAIRFGFMQGFGDGGGIPGDFFGYTAVEFLVMGHMG